jgi:hypothetical protein
MRTAVRYILLLTVAASTAHARDCSRSRPFRLYHQQHLSGIFVDPNGAELPGLGIQLLAGRKVIRDTYTHSNGEYDFGDVPKGIYRIRINGHSFCSPKVQCNKEECIIEQKLELNSDRAIIVR